MSDARPPAAPQPRGFHWHYAWVVVGASLLVEFFGIGFGFFALIASYPYFEALGWARTTVVFSSTVMITTIAILSPLTGAYMDRRSSSSSSLPVRREDTFPDALGGQNR